MSRAECRHAECRYDISVMLSFVTPSVIMLNACILSVVRLNVIMLTVVAPVQRGR